MNNETTDNGAAVPCISLSAASVALKEYLESPACTIPGFDIPDAIWMPFADAVDAEEEKANASVRMRAMESISKPNANLSLPRDERG